MMQPSSIMRPLPVWSMLLLTNICANHHRRRRCTQDTIANVAALEVHKTEAAGKIDRLQAELRAAHAAVGCGRIGCPVHSVACCTAVG